EVRSQVTVTASGTDVALTYDSDGAESLPAETYHPIKWTLTCAGNDVVNATLATSCTNVTLAEIVAFINAMDATVEANAAYTYAGTYTLTWAWDFENASGITGLTANQADTILGAAAANSVSNGAYTYTDPQGNAFDCTAKTGVDFTMSIEVSQIQK
ncbi:MAG: hypothetical protein IJF71_03695, partial [Clostridia bacterium]|nr:hypothetical protein [Clostridia bacterium]